MMTYQIPRNSLAWMLAAQLAVCAPHVVRLPIVISLMCLACGFWRVMVYQGRWSYPGPWVKTIFVLGGFASIPLSYSKLTGLEPAIALLIVAFALKLLEMHHKKDAYVVILLAYFVAITEFLFFQTIPTALYMLVAVTMITAALIGLHQTKTHQKPLRTFQTAALLLGQSIPLMLVLFVFFPRVTPLWTVADQSSVGKSGVSNTMSPGDIALLAQSDDLAFRATFESTVPDQRALYWRGLILSKFDGKTWRQRDASTDGVWRYRQKTPKWVENIAYLGEEQRYSIVLEATQQNWLFALAMPALPKNRDLVMLSEYSLASRLLVNHPLRYELSSYLNFSLSKDIDPMSRYRNTKFPKWSNPETQALAKTMFEQSNRSPQTYINDVLRMYNQQEFIYTLKPPSLGRHGIDDFLLGTKRGFCEHYAGSFVFLMRAVGIPARVVVGYQGGEYNPRGNYISVRQFDAHAWTEVWLKDQGWFRVDPTSAVAPERIERGLQAAVAEENTFLASSPLSIFRYRQLLWLTELRLQFDAIGHYWDTWVVGYTAETQEGILRRFLGDANQQRIGTIMLSLFFAVLAIIGFLLLARRSKAIVIPANAQYRKFCDFMEKRGLGRKVGEAPFDYAARVAIEAPYLRQEIDALTKEYVRMSYIDDNMKNVKMLKKAGRALRLKSLMHKAV